MTGFTEHANDPEPVLKMTEAMVADAVRRTADILIGKGIPAEQVAAGMLLAAHEAFVLHWGPIAFVEVARGTADNIEQLYMEELRNGGAT